MKEQQSQHGLFGSPYLTLDLSLRYVTLVCLSYAFGLCARVMCDANTPVNGPIPSCEYCTMCGHTLYEYMCLYIYMAVSHWLSDQEKTKDRPT